MGTGISTKLSCYLGWKRELAKSFPAIRDGNWKPKKVFPLFENRNSRLFRWEIYRNGISRSCLMQNAVCSVLYVACSVKCVLLSVMCAACSLQPAVQTGWRQDAACSMKWRLSGGCMQHAVQQAACSASCLEAGWLLQWGRWQGREAAGGSTGHPTL